MDKKLTTSREANKGGETAKKRLGKESRKELNTLKTPGKKISGSNSRSDLKVESGFSSSNGQLNATSLVGSEALSKQSPEAFSKLDDLLFEASFKDHQNKRRKYRHGKMNLDDSEISETLFDSYVLPADGQPSEELTGRHEVRRENRREREAERERNQPPDSHPLKMNDPKKQEDNHVSPYQKSIRHGFSREWGFAKKAEFQLEETFAMNSGTFAPDNQSEYESNPVDVQERAKKTQAKKRKSADNSLANLQNIESINNDSIVYQSVRGERDIAPKKSINKSSQMFTQ